MSVRHTLLMIWPFIVAGGPLVEITLVDGSELAGEFAEPTLAATAEFGEVALPVASITRVKRRSEGELVLFRNGDRLSVKLSGESLKVRTQFGPVTVPVATVAGIVMRDARALPPHLASSLMLHLPLDSETPRDGSQLESVLATVGTEFRADGKHRGGHLFNGSLSAITIRNDKLDIAESLSICLWARMDGPSSNSDQRLYQRGYGGHRSVELWVEDAATTHGNVVFRINASAAPSVRIDYPIPNFEYGRWYHYSAIFDDDNDELRLYIDGQQVGSTPFHGAIGTGYPINIIGNWRARGERSWLGMIDDFLLFNRPLNQADISTMYRR